MPQERFPEDYEKGTLQRIYERLRQALTRSEKKAEQDLQDMTEDLSREMADQEDRLARKIESTQQEGFGVPVTIPVPKDLTVFELGIWGLAYVDPFIRWKYMGKIKGYEFYGSSNSGFAPHETTYNQTGYHTGADGSIWLDTADTSDLYGGAFVLDHRLVKPLDQITLYNETKGTSGPITSYGVPFKYKIAATGVTWDAGDAWRIRHYPANKLFSVGSFCTYPKRLGNFYILSRTVGAGNTYSQFTSEQQSIGWSSEVELDVPVIVYPVHTCGSTCTIGSQGTANWGKPICPTHDVVPWNEIMSGTRETDHHVFFGIEWCNVELVWTAIETAQRGVWYDTRRGITKTEDPDFT